jgi:hypothetical protein
MPPRFFTIEQANRMLPELGPILEALRREKHLLDVASEERAALQAKARSNGHSHGAELAALDRQVRERTAAAKDLIDRVTALGVQVKDIELGLVDFPTIHQGRRVLLCWRLGEERVGFWHEWSEGFAGRRPLPDG